MPSDKTMPSFKSALGPLMEQYIQEMRACGYLYNAGAVGLKYLDQYLFECRHSAIELPKSIMKLWIAKRDNEAHSTQQHRICLTRQFARFLIRLGYPAYVPDSTLLVNPSSSFTPYIFTHDEICRFFNSVKQISSSSHSPIRHLVMPEIFYLLYGCGFRINEVLNLRVNDVDLDRGLLIVREGKLLKDRLVPPSPSLVARLRKYEGSMGKRPQNALFFSSLAGKKCSYPTVSKQFRSLLLKSDIHYGGRGKGPRLHDLRHTFAVHTLMRWYQEGVDLNAKLPLLATYLGHAHLRGTQHYLHLTEEFFPGILMRVNHAFGDVIPTGAQS